MNVGEETGLKCPEKATVHQQGTDPIPTMKFKEFEAWKSPDDRKPKQWEAPNQMPNAKLSELLRAP